MLTRSSKRIYNPSRYTGVLLIVQWSIKRLTIIGMFAQWNSITLLEKKKFYFVLEIAEPDIFYALKPYTMH